MSGSGRHMLNRLSDAYGRTQQLLSLNGYSPFPLVVNCLVTLVCDAGCDFCLAKTGRIGDPRDNIDTALWRSIFAQIPSWTILGFSGGEVFLHPEIRQILTAACQRHRCAIVTNGLHWDDRRFDWIASLGAKNTIASGLVNLGVSLNEDIADEAEYTQRLAKKFRFFKQARSARKAGFPRLELKVPVRDDTAPYLDRIAVDALQNGAEAVTFQMLTSIEFMFFRGFTKQSATTLEALTDYRYQRGVPPPFSRRQELAESLRRIIVLPPDIRRRLSFMPNIPPGEFLAYYLGKFEPSRMMCTHPWIHAAIDPTGTMYQCLNPHGVNLLNVEFSRIWNAPSLRTFRRELRQQRLFPRCAGCCFLVMR